MNIRHLGKPIIWSFRSARFSAWLWRPLVWQFWRRPRLEYEGEGSYRWWFGPLDGSARGFARKEWDKYGRRKPGY